MKGTYQYCHDIVNAVCGPNVVNMYHTYFSCHNLTGSPVCGNNVVNMSFSYGAYSLCANLSGSPACGEKVVNMYRAYWGCPKLCGNMYMYSS
jgi:hypothetical protein